FVAEMLFHELRSLPLAQFAFGVCRAPLGVGSLGGERFQHAVGIKRSRRSLRRMRIGRRTPARIRERPFQCPMNDEVGIPPNRRSKVRVLVKAEREKSQRTMQ